METCALVGGSYRAGIIHATACRGGNATLVEQAATGRGSGCVEKKEEDDDGGATKYSTFNIHFLISLSFCFK